MSCSFCSGTSRFGPDSSSLYSSISRVSRCIGSGSVVWGGVSVFGGGDWGCGGDGGCSVMMVDGVVSGSGSSCICMIGISRTIERVQGTVDEMG